jgi:hypothetical protein
VFCCFFVLVWFGFWWDWSLIQSFALPKQVLNHWNHNFNPFALVTLEMWILELFA